MPNPENYFKPGNNYTKLRKNSHNAGRPPKIATVIMKSIREILKEPARDKRAGIDAISRIHTVAGKMWDKMEKDDTPLQALIAALNYIAPVPSSETEDVVGEVLTPGEREALAALRCLNLEGLEKIKKIAADPKNRQAF